MVEVKVYKKGKQELPKYETIGAAGFDIRADFQGKTEFMGDGFIYNDETKEITLKAQSGRVLVPTGLFMEIPQGYELQIRPRSGLALKHGISLVNSPGTIDSDYIGEIGIILLNTGFKDFTFKDDERIAQGVLSAVEQLKFKRVSLDAFAHSERGAGGFGHTGKQ